MKGLELNGVLVRKIQIKPLSCCVETNERSSSELRNVIKKDQKNLVFFIFLELIVSMLERQSCIK